MAVSNLRIIGSASGAMAARGATGVAAAAPSGYTSVNCLSFVAGSSQRVDLPANDAIFDITNNLTLSAWVKGNNATFGGIFSNGAYSATDIAYYITQDAVSASKFEVVVSNSGNTDKYYRSSITAFDGAWHHVAITFASNVLLVYIDGSNDASVVKVNDVAVNTLKATAQTARLGCLVAASNTPANYLTGKLNNISLWAVAMSAGEITELYHSGKPYDLTTHSQAANLKVWYKCGDGDTIGVNGILDSSGNAKHGNPVNSPTIVADAP